MLTKVLAGVVAAVAVAGTGVYFGLASVDCHKCSGGARVEQSVSTPSPCCSADEAPCCSVKAPSCCSESAPTDAVAACTGSTSLISAKAPACETGACPKAGACCDEKK